VHLITGTLTCSLLEGAAHVEVKEIVRIFLATIFALRAARLAARPIWRMKWSSACLKRSAALFGVTYAMGCAPESRVRNRLAAGGRWIRTFGPPATVSSAVALVARLAARDRGAEAHAAVQPASFLRHRPVRRKRATRFVRGTDGSNPSSSMTMFNTRTSPRLGTCAWCWGSPRCWGVVGPVTAFGPFYLGDRVSSASPDAEVPGAVGGRASDEFLTRSVARSGRYAPSGFYGWSCSGSKRWLP
jgi:hypothetical protein